MILILPVSDMRIFSILRSGKDEGKYVRSE